MASDSGGGAKTVRKYVSFVTVIVLEPRLLRVKPELVINEGLEWFLLRFLLGDLVVPGHADRTLRSL